MLGLITCTDDLQKLFRAADREANQQYATAGPGAAAAVAGFTGFADVFEHMQASKLNRPLINGYGWLALWERIKARGRASIVFFEASIVLLPLCLVAMAGLAHMIHEQF